MITCSLEEALNEKNVAMNKREILEYVISRIEGDPFLGIKPIKTRAEILKFLKENLLKQSSHISSSAKAVLNSANVDLRNAFVGLEGDYEDYGEKPK